MATRVLVLALFMICSLEFSDSLDPLESAKEMIMEQAINVATKDLPKGYVELLNYNKSGFFTKILHWLFGDTIEKRFRNIIQQDVKLMPESMPIDDVESDNKERKTFTNGVMEGLKSIEVTPKTGVTVTWSTGLTGPTAVVSIFFKNLVIKGDFTGKFELYQADIKINGKVTIKVLQNNFVLTFRLHPGIFEGCYLKLVDVVVTDLEHLEWNVKKAKTGKDDENAATVLRDYFVHQEGNVEEHIKTSIVNMIYQQVPKASPAICDNDNKFLRLSQYQTFKMGKPKVVVVTTDSLPKP